MAVKNKEEKITLESLVLIMKQGFVDSEKRIIKAVDKKIDTKIDELAIMTKHGFDSVGEQFKGVDERFDKMDERFDKFEKTNSQEHENASLRLGEVAYRFELVDLKKRVEVLEKKAAVRV